MFLYWYCMQPYNQDIILKNKRVTVQEQKKKYW